MFVFYWADWVMSLLLGYKRTFDADFQLSDWKIVNRQFSDWRTKTGANALEELPDLPLR